MVQLATSVKRKVTKKVKGCRVSIKEMDTYVNLNILPLGSFDILIGMDWLESHKTIIDCLHKIFNCIDDEGKYHTIKGIYRPITMGQI